MLKKRKPPRSVQRKCVRIPPWAVRPQTVDGLHLNVLPFRFGMEIHARHFPFGVHFRNFILPRNRTFVDKKDADSKEKSVQDGNASTKPVFQHPLKLSFDEEGGIAKP